MGDINANRLTISKQMLEGVVKDPNSKKLVDQILADGVVDGKDAAALADLKKNLQSLAEKDDGNIDADEEAFLESLTDTGWLSDEDVTKSNLQSIQSLQKQHASNPSALNFNTETPGVNITIDSFIGKDETRVLRLRDLDPVDSSVEPPAVTPAPAEEGTTPVPPPQTEGSTPPPVSAPTETPTVTPVAESTPAVTPTPAASEPTPETPAAAQPVTPSPAEQAYQQNAEQVLAPLKEQRDAAVKTLQDQATKLKEAYADPAKVPDDKLRGDLAKLAEAANDDPQFVLNTLKSMGITPEQLAKEGVLSAETVASPTYVPFSEREKLSTYLQNKQFSDTEVNAYRASLVNSLENYISDPSEANRLEMKAKIYDNSYVFEPSSGATSSGMTAGDLNTYTAFKQTLLDVGQKEKLLTNTQTSLRPGSATLPTTLSEMNASLSRRNTWAQEDVIKFVGDAEALIAQVEANPAAFNNVDISRLKSLVSQLGTTVPEPKLACVPLSASTLTTLNETWAEIENVGLKAGLNRETSDIVNAGLQQVNEGSPLSAALKSNPVLLNNPELARVISENPILLDALRSGDTAKVNTLLTQYSSEQMRRAMSFGFGLAGSFMGAIGFGAYSSTLTNMATQISLSTIAPLSMGLNYGSGQSSLLGGSGFNLNQEGSNLNLSGVSVQDIRTLAESLAATPQEQQDALFANLDNISVAGQDDPAINTIQQQVAAKEAFDKAFWNNSSALDIAQAGVSSALERQNEFSANLQLAKNAIEQQKSGNISAEARKQLNQMTAAIDVAMAAIKKGEPIPESVKSSLELVSRTLAGHDPSVDLGASFVKVAESNSVLSQLRDQASNPEAVQKFQSRFNQLSENNPELKAVKDQIDAFASSPDQYMADMERVLSQPNLDPAVRAQIVANLNAVNQLVQKSQQEGVSDADLISFGKTPTGTGAVKASPLDAIVELGALAKFAQKQGETTNLGERVNALYDWSDAQVTNSGAAGAAPATRAQIFASLGDNIKSYEKFYNKDSVTNLAASTETQTKIESDVNRLLSSDETTRTALQNIWSGNAGLSGDINLRGSAADLTKFAGELEKRVGTLRGSTSLSESQRSELQAAEALLLALKGPPGRPNVGLIAVANSRQETVRNMLGAAGQQMQITETRLNDLYSDPAFRGSEAALALPDLLDMDRPPTQEEINALCQKAPPHLRGRLQAVISSHFAAMGYGTLSAQLETGRPPLSPEDVSGAVNLQARNKGNDYLLSIAPPDNAPQGQRNAHAQLLEEYNALLNNLPPGKTAEEAIREWVSQKLATNALTPEQGRALHNMVDRDLASTRANFTSVSAGERAITHVATTVNMPSLVGNTSGEPDHTTPGQPSGLPLAPLSTTSAPPTAPMSTASAPAGGSPVTTTSSGSPTATGTTGGSGAPPSSWDTMRQDGRRRRERLFSGFGIQLDPNRPLGQARDRFRERVGLPPVSATTDNNTQGPSSSGAWFNAASYTTGLRMTDIAQRERSGQPIAGDIQSARADLQQDMGTFNTVASAMGSHASVLRESVPFIAQTLGVELPPDLMAGLQGTDPSISPDDADLSSSAQELVDKADELANAILSPKPMVDGRDALAGLLKDFLDNIRNLDFQTRKLVMAQFAKRLMNNMITKLYAEKNLENAKYHEKSLDQFKARMKEGIERILESQEAQASSGQAAMAVGGDLGAKTGSAIADAGISDRALRDDASQFLEPAVQDGVLTRVQKQKILQALFEGSSITGQEGLMAMLTRFQQARSSIVTQ